MSNTCNMERLDNPIVSANPQTHVEGSTTTLFNRDSGQIRSIHKPECRPPHFADPACSPAICKRATGSGLVKLLQRQSMTTAIHSIMPERA